MSQVKRLDKIEGALTPRQAVVLWLQEAHQYPNLTQYVQYLRGKDKEAPLWQVTEQVEQATKEAMKGRPQAIVDATVRRAVRDAAFLVHLHHQCNFKVMHQQGGWQWQLMALRERLLRMLAEESHRATLKVFTALCLEREEPYPLDPATAEAVEATINNHVTAWAELEEDILEQWLDTHLLQRGARQLPQGSYEFREGKFRPAVTEQNEPEVRACFEDQAEFERFRCGEDYSHGLAGVRDAEYREHYDRMVTEAKKLVQSGKVKEGCCAWLETVPVPFLREAPLLEGKWLDRHVAELAEWGALLRQAGYQAKEIDEHHLACDSFFDGEAAVSRARMAALQRQAEKRLQTFPGRTRKIAGREYLNLEDYAKWLGRGVEGDLVNEVAHGFQTNSWNRWIGSHKGPATVGGIAVDRLHCYVSQYAYCCSANYSAEREHRRHRIASEVQALASPSRRQMDLARDFRGAAECFLMELRGMKDAFATIGRRYFAGQEVLFPELAECVAELGADAEGLVERFASLCKDKDGLEPVDRDRVQRGSAAVAADLRAYLVDMAKADALEFMGDGKAGLELVERHLD